MACSQQENVLWVTTSQDRSLDKGGIVYRLNLATLDVTQIIHDDLKPFSAAINHATGMLWFGNTVDSTITATDTKAGAVKGRLVPDKRQRSETICPLQPHELAVNEQTNTVYITGLNEENAIWVVNNTTLKLKTTITGTGATAMGLTIDPQAKHLCITSADGGLLTTDSESNIVVSHKKLQDDDKAHFHLDLSPDTIGHRALITDSKQPEVLVVDTCGGKVLGKITAPGSLAVLSNPTCNEACVTYHKAREVGAIGGKRYRIVKAFKAPTHPNSLAFSDDGKTLYVSVKQASSREKEAAAPDDVIRITL